MEVEIQFTQHPIVVPEWVLSSREVGAVVEFHGVVREMEDGGKLDGLYYEAYEVMARKVMARHFEELAGIHACDAVTFIHRLGWVPVGEASLYVSVMSAHRGPGLRLLTEAIDRLKLDVPIWKRVAPPRFK